MANIIVGSLMAGSRAFTFQNELAGMGGGCPPRAQCAASPALQPSSHTEHQNGAADMGMGPSAERGLL